MWKSFWNIWKSFLFGFSLLWRHLILLSLPCSRSRFVGCLSSFFSLDFGFSFVVIIIFFSIFGVVLPRRNVTGESSNCAPPVIESNEKMAGKVSGPLADPVPNSFWDTRNEFTEFFSCSNWFCSHLTGFLAWQWVWLALTGFDWVRLGLTGIYWDLLGFTGFYLVLLSFT